MPYRFVRLSAPVEKDRDVQLRFGKVRLENRCPLEMRCRLGELAPQLQDTPEIVVRFRQIRLQSQSLFIRCLGLGQAARHLASVRKIAMPFREIGLDLHRLAIGGNRFLGLPLPHERVSEIVVPGEKIGVESQHAPETGPCIVWPVELHEQNSQFAMGFGIARTERKRLFISANRLLSSPGGTQYEAHEAPAVDVARFVSNHLTKK